MKLSERLAQIDPEQIVSVGCINGHGFVEIEKVKDLTKALRKNQINSELKESAKLMELQQRQIELPGIIEKLVVEYGHICLMDLTKVGVAASLDRKKREIELRRKELSGMPKAIQWHQELLESSRSPFVEREVMDEYDNMEGIVILIEGADRGCYWFKGDNTYAKHIQEDITDDETN